MMSLLILIACEDIDLHTRDRIMVLYYVLEPEDKTLPDVTLYFENTENSNSRTPIIIGGQLQADTKYRGTVQLRFASDRSTRSVEHVVNEQGILKHPESHQVFFHLSPEVDMMINYADRDTLGFPIGLRTQLFTKNNGQGTLTITIRYDVGKSSPGVSSGDITHAGGANDISVEFPITVDSDH